MNRFTTFFIISFVIHISLGAVLLYQTGFLGGKKDNIEVINNMGTKANSVEKKSVLKEKKHSSKQKKKVTKKATAKKSKADSEDKTEVAPKEVKTDPTEKKELTPKETKVDPVKEVAPKEAVTDPTKKEHSSEKENNKEPDKNPSKTDPTEKIEPTPKETKADPVKEVAPKEAVTDPTKKEHSSEKNSTEKKETAPKELETDPAKEVAPKEEEADPVEEAKAGNTNTPLLNKPRSYNQLKQVSDNPLPNYPEEALKNKWEGRVEVLYYVDPAGFVEKIQLKKSSGHKVLDNTALRALSRYRYEPGQEGWVRHPVEFFLELDKEVTKTAPLGVRDPAESKTK